MTAKTDKKARKRKSSLFLTLKGLFFRTEGDIQSLLEEEQMQSPFRTILKNFRENRVAMTGVLIFLLIFLCCVILPFFYPLDLTYQDATQQNIAPGFGLLKVSKGLQGKAAQVSAGGVFAAGLDQDGVI